MRDLAQKTHIRSLSVPADCLRYVTARIQCPGCNMMGTYHYAAAGFEAYMAGVPPDQALIGCRVAARLALDEGYCPACSIDTF